MEDDSMKKFLLKATTAVGLLISLSGIASAEDIKVWTLTHSNEAANEAWDDIVKSFEAENPDISIKVENRGTDEHKSALRIAAGSDQGPDIYFMWAGLGLGGEFVNSGLSLALDSYYKQYDWDNKFSGASIGFSKAYKGERHGVPYTFHGEAIYYNKALFEKAGITSEPKTYDELKAAAEKLAAANIPAFTFGGTVNWHIMRLMDMMIEVKCGAEKHDKLMGMELNWETEPCAAESFDELKYWTSNHFLKPFMGIDQSQSYNLFLGNRAAMMLEGDWLTGSLLQDEREDDYGIFAFPTGEDRLYGFAEYNYISSKSSKADIAAKFLDYFGSADVQQKHLGNFGAISVSSHVKYDNVRPLDQLWIDIFAKYSETFVNGDQAFPLDVTTEYFRIINEIASDNMTSKDAAKAMQTFIDGRG